MIISSRRRPVEQINRELKRDRESSEHQVSKEEGRIEKFIDMAVLAYLLLIRVCRQEILPDKALSVSQLQHAFRYGSTRTKSRIM